MALEDRVCHGHGEAQNRGAGDDPLQDFVRLVGDMAWPAMNLMKW
jgi:hypothetical protein